MANKKTSRSAKSPARHKRIAWWSSILSGIIYGAGDDDPAAIGTYSQIGAQTGTNLLWLLFISTPMLAVVQATVAKFAVVTKKGLSTLLKQQYGTGVAVFAALLIGCANIATLGADIAGMASGAALVVPADWHLSWQWFVIPFVGAIWALEVYGGYKIIQGIFILLALVLNAYIAVGIISHPDWKILLRDTFIPQLHFKTAYFTAGIGLLGATISPYMFYFQAAEEVEDNTSVRNLKSVSLHTIVGMIYSNVISYFIILSTAVVLHVHGAGVEINSAQQAAQALAPLAGRWAGLLLGLGLIGSGLLAVPVLAAATATMIGEVFNWRVGLSRKVKSAHAYYLTLSAALVLGIALALSGIDPIKSLFWSQVLSGVVAPVLVFLIFRLATRKELLGKHVNNWVQQFWGWLTFGVMIVAIGVSAYGWIAGNN